MTRHTKATLFLGLIALGACARNTSSTTAGTTPSPSAGVNVVGSTSPRRAVEAFMDAVKSQDLQQMSTAWGTQKGPARDQMKREELEKRLIVIQCMLQHDSWKFAEAEPRLSAGGRQEFLVEVKRKKLSARTTFTTVQGPQQRWFVEIVDVQPLREFCA